MRRCLLLALAFVIAVTAPSEARKKKSDKALAPLIELSRSFEAIAELVRPAVVEIIANRYAAGGGNSGEGLLTRSLSTGTGVILDSDGFIVTNAHVIAGARRVQVTLAPRARQLEERSSILKGTGDTVPARIVGIDLETDLAVLAIEGEDHPALELADSDQVRPGQLALAIGSARGLESSVTMGVVSATARQLQSEDPMIYIQTDTPINPGNSGGPLVDAAGRVIGINTMILSESGGHEGIGFAAPANIVRAIFDQLRENGRVRRGTIGAHAQTITPLLAAGLALPLERGVILGDVLRGGPAAEAGLRVGDVILTLDGKLMENGRQLDVNLYRKRIDSVVALEVLRDRNERFKALVSVIERPDDSTGLDDLVSPDQNVIEAIGILALELSDDVRRMLPPLRHDDGVVVAARSSAAVSASGAGLRPGDVIYSINRERVRNIAELRARLASYDEGAPLAVQIERQGGLRFLALELD